MDENFDYPAEAAVTMSEEFHADNVSLLAFRYTLGETICLLNDLDRIKKALFYGREYMHLKRQDVFGGVETLLREFDNTKQGEHVLHGVLGIATEAGELLEALRAVIQESKPIDITNFKEELGDLFWYIALLAREFGLSFEDIQRSNIAKLRTRYPNKFTEFDANHRNLEAEKDSLVGFLGDK